MVTQDNAKYIARPLLFSAIPKGNTNSLISFLIPNRFSASCISTGREAAEDVVVIAIIKILANPYMTVRKDIRARIIIIPNKTDKKSNVPTPNNAKNLNNGINTVKPFSAVTEAIKAPIPSGASRNTN